MDFKSKLSLGICFTSIYGVLFGIYYLIWSFLLDSVPQSNEWYSFISTVLTVVFFFYSSGLSISLVILLCMIWLE
jgi:DMSO reductase anchor subunit